MSSRTLLASVFLVLALPCAAYAQVLYGSIVGNITDASQAAVPGATVTITNAQTNLVRNATTSETGAYSFTNLPTGVYSLKVSKEGFTSYAQSQVAVTINSISRIDASLNVGAVTESVTVSGEAATLQTDRSEIRQEIVSKQLLNLPVPLGRNYQQLFRVLPGFAPPANAHSVPTNPSRALAFNVNGASRSSNNTRIDGASSTLIQLPHVVAYVPSLESIETVNVVTNSFDAEQGLAGGAAISVQTKSGTNNVHGALFEYHTNQHLKAKPFILPAGQRKPKLVNNQFGGAAGGPIRKDKLFYFAAYEGTYDRAAASRFGTVPSAAIKAGDMSASPRPVFDPATGDALGNNRIPFASNLVPLARHSSISRKLVDLTPLPNLSALTNNYFLAAPFQFDRHTIDSKVNWQVNDKLSTFVRFSALRYKSFNQELFGELGGPPINGGNAGNSDGGTYSTTVALNYVVKPNFLIDAYYGYTRQDTSSAQSRLDENLGRDLLGIPGTNGTRRFEGGWPTFAITDYTTIGTNDNFMPYYRRDPQYQYVSNFNWIKGTHNVRFGFDLYRQHLNQNQAEFVGGGAVHGAQGGFTFGGNPTLSPTGPSSNQFNSYAGFLLGLPTVIGKILQVPDEYNLRAWLHSYYVRDRWNITPRLTLDYGVRWEYFPVPTRSDRGLESYDPVTNKVSICGFGQVPNDCGVKMSKRKFAPRVGIAYRATNSTVLRAGYGITNDPFLGTELRRANYPVLIPLVIEPPNNAFQAAGRLEDGIPAIRVPDYGNGIVDIPGNYAFADYPRDFRRGYLQSWNFAVQKQLGQGFTAEVAYVATRETNKMAYLDINAGQVIGRGNAGRPLSTFGRTATTTFLAPVGTGQYNSLQTKLERRFAQGVQFNATYVWAKSIGPLDNSDSSPSIKAVDYFALNRVVRSFDRTHTAHVSTIWEIPFGKGRKWATSGASSWILGGWQVNNILSLMTGTPFTVSASGNSLNLPGSSQQADQVKPEVQILGGTGRGQPFFDPLAFEPVTAARFGTSGINTLRGPGIVNWDLGVFREFAVSERWKVQFRMESFNFSNTPHFANPGANRSNLLLNPDGSIQNLNGFSEITGVTNLAREGIDERQFRFGLRLSF
jgi:hypothetical protein